MRAIDRDALIEFIENRYDITWKNDYEGGIKDACTDILEKISKMPTIEPERKKGKWIVVDADIAENSDICECDQCSGRIWNYKNAKNTWNYCPRCGADMRGDDDDQSK